MTLVVAAVCSVAGFAGPKVSILGDSYSTFQGAIPAGYAVWYDGTKNGVDSVEKTWWSIAIKALGGQLEKCDAFSGATISATGYGGADYSDRSFVTRATRLGNPDIILVCGATNDSWANSPLGEQKLSGWTDEDLKCFYPSMSKLLDVLTKTYPKAKIYFILNDDLKPEISRWVKRCCNKKRVPVIELDGSVTKEHGHPDAAGMIEFARKVVATVDKSCLSKVPAGVAGAAAGDASRTFVSDGFGCTFSNAGTIQNLTYRGKPLAKSFFQIAGDATIEGASDSKLVFRQERLARNAKVTKNDDGTMTAVAEFPVRGGSGTEYMNCKVTTTVSSSSITVIGEMNRSCDFNFGNYLFRGEGEWLLDFMAGGKVDFETWDGNHTIKEIPVKFSKGIDAPGCVKTRVSGKLGDWELAVSGGYFCDFHDMRKWGGNAFKQCYVGQETITWGGTKGAPAKSVVSFTMRQAEKLDEAAIAKAKAEQEAREAAEAKAKADAMKPIVAAFPSKAEMWSLKDAGHDKTAARERFSLNGLWAFKVDNNPGDLKVAPALAGMPYFFKVPGKWPSTNKWAARNNGMAVYNEKGVDCFGSVINDNIQSAWYGRKVVVPSDWKGKRVIFGMRWVPTAVFVYVDGEKAGDIFFPGGELDLTAKLTPGEHDIALFTSAKLPEKMLLYFDAPDQARTVTKKEIAEKGINGDVYIAAEPDGVKLDDVQVRSFVADGKIDFSLGFTGAGSEQVTAVAEIAEKGKTVKTIKSKPFTAKAGERFVFGEAWKNAKVWDVDAPQNLYTVKVRLEKGGKTIDELYPEEFGFREVTVNGRDLLLNGKPLHLRPDYSRVCRESAAENKEMEEAYKAVRKYGFNFEIDGAYGFAEGDLADFEASIRAASNVGMPSVCGLPHPCNFAPPDKPLHWNLKGLYRKYLDYEVKKLQNIPGLLLWSSTHNQTGYEADQNPEIMTGKPEDIPSGIIGWRQSFRNSSKEVNAIMREVDPGRPIYHHESGANGEFYTLNAYLDWAPIQERSDWLEKWEAEGVMPLFIVEWGAPHIASWASYRGEDNGRNIWSARGKTTWAWVDEFNAAYLGEEAFHLNPVKHQWRELIAFYCKGNKPNYYGGFDRITTKEPDMNKVTAMFMKRNHRDMRARGVTMILPWDMESTHFKWPEGRERKVRENALDGIKGFGVVRSDYTVGFHNIGGMVPNNDTGATIVDTYSDLIGWIAGPDEKNFTYVNDTYRQGEIVKKSLMIVNDCRKDQTVEYAWKAGAEKGKGSVVVKAGRRAQVPFSFKASESCDIVAGFKCADTGWKYRDTFKVNVIAAKTKSNVKSVALFDPEGTAKPVLKAIGVKFNEVTAAPKSGVLVIGRNAYDKLPFALNDVVAAGVKVVMLEQCTDNLRKLGFRVQEHGFRNAYACDPEFAALDLTDWRGDATMLPWYIGIDKMSGDFPRWEWEPGIKNTRVWRAGNRGIVSCALPEKPSRGDFRALVSCGFNLQYAPVMEYFKPGQRLILSQLDICGRSEPSPEAEEALAKILDYADRPAVAKKGNVFLLEGQGKAAKTLSELGIAYKATAQASDAKAGDVLVLGPGAKPGNLTALVEKGVNVLALGFTGDEVNAVFPAAKAVSSKWESWPDYNDQIGKEPAFLGVSNADITWNYPECMASMARFDDKTTLKAFHAGAGVFVANAIVPWQFNDQELALRHNRRRAQALVTRLVCNLGGTADAGTLGAGAKLYADKPQSIDDPYRYFRW